MTWSSNNSLSFAGVPLDDTLGKGYIDGGDNIMHPKVSADK